MPPMNRKVPGTSTTSETWSWVKCSWCIANCGVWARGWHFWQNPLLIVIYSKSHNWRPARPSIYRRCWRRRHAEKSDAGWTLRYDELSVKKPDTSWNMLHCQPIWPRSIHRFKKKQAKLQAKCDRKPWCPDPFPYVVLSGRLLNPGLFLSFQTPMPCDAVMQIRPQKSNFIKTRMQWSVNKNANYTSDAELKWPQSWGLRRVVWWDSWTIAG